jgi:hypothetical protein
VEHIHGEATRSKSIRLEKLNPDLVLMNLKVVKLYQTGKSESPPSEQRYPGRPMRLASEDLFSDGRDDLHP